MQTQKLLKHTPLTSPLPNALACAQGGLLKLWSGVGQQPSGNYTSPLAEGISRRDPFGTFGTCGG
jgi:hypothetical protein